MKRHQLPTLPMALCLAEPVIAQNLDNPAVSDYTTLTSLQHSTELHL